MKFRRSKRALRARGFRSAVKHLSIESLETRALLASLTSRLPPITVTAGSEPVQIRQLADPAQEITVTSAVVSAFNQLASLQEMFADPNQFPNDEGMLADLQQETWAPIDAAMEYQTFEPLDLEAAIEIATQGFEVNRPPLEVAIQQIFGASLSKSRPDTSLDFPSDSDALIEEITSNAGGNSIETPDTSAPLTTDLQAEIQTDANPETDSHKNEKSAPAPSSDRHENSRRTIEDVERQFILDKPANEHEDKQRDDREAMTKDMLVLPQPPANRRVPAREEIESQSGTDNHIGRVAIAEEALLEQMLLLPMVQDSGKDRQLAMPTVVAGFNPVAMLQIFVGAEFSSSKYEGSNVENGERASADEVETASSVLLRGDRLAAIALVAAIGYWYVHSAEEVAFANGISPKSRDRRPTRWMQFVNYFGQRVKQFGQKFSPR